MRQIRNLDCSRSKIDHVMAFKTRPICELGVSRIPSEPRLVSAWTLGVTRDICDTFSFKKSLFHQTVSAGLALH